MSKNGRDRLQRVRQMGQPEAAPSIEFTDLAVARPSHFLYFDSFRSPAKGGPSHFSLHAFAGVRIARTVCP